MIHTFCDPSNLEQQLLRHFPMIVVEDLVATEITSSISGISANFERYFYIFMTRFPFNS